MKTIKVLNEQSVLDIAISACGNMESAYEIAEINNIDVFSYPAPCTILQVPGVAEAKVTKLFASDKPVSKVVQAAPKPSTVDIAYSELRFLRDNGAMIPGYNYKIIDYVTTTTQRGTSTANHRFNVIVNAVSNYELLQLQ